jgi:MFS family permease
LAINYAVIGTCAILSGKIAEKYKTQKIQLIIGYFLGILAGIGYLIINAPLQLYLLQILAGLSYAISQPGFGGIFSENLKSKFSSGWGYYFGITYWAGALACLYSGYVSQIFGFNALFISLITTQTISLIGAVYIFFKLKTPIIYSGKKTLA